MAPTAGKEDGAYTPSFGDPYKILSIPFGSNDDEISKAYRKLALKFHPDKLHGKNAEESSRAAQKFHGITEAKSFLLDAENSGKRKQYDIRRKAAESLRVEREQRERSMDDRRRRLRDELLANERRAAKSKEQKQASSNENRFFRGGGNLDEEALDGLRRDGQRMREQHQRRQEEQRTLHQRDTKEALEKLRLRERQIRLKWTRSSPLGKVMTSSSSTEQSLSRLLRTDSNDKVVVESVELIGAKGNQALVTLAESPMCEICVDAYLDSDEIRATYVAPEYHSRRRQRSRNSLHRGVDRESQEWTLRRALEREELLNKIEREEKEELNPHKKKESVHANQYPPPLPYNEEEIHMTPFERLERMERAVLTTL